MQITFRFGLFVFESEISVTLKHLLKYSNGYDPPPSQYLWLLQPLPNSPLSHIGNADVGFMLK